jgi:hypothetical protein
MDKKGIIEDLSNSFNLITQIERLSVFAFTLIIIFLVIYNRTYSLGLILMCFSCILFFLRIGFFRTKKSFSDSNTNQSRTEELILFDQESNKYIKEIKLIYWASIILFIIGIIILFI